MGIGINVGMNQDYSYLFSGLSGSGSLGNLNFLSDYASIKNGSYGKLLKTYYGNAASSSTVTSASKTRTSNVLDQILEEKKHPTVSKETQEANANLTTGISSLKNVVTTLQNQNTYTTLEDGRSGADKVLSAMKDYVSQYNDVVSAAKNSTLTSKTSHVAAMMRSSASNADKLAEIGVTVNGDGTLFLDESKLKSVDISKVQELFSKDNIISYGSTVKSRLGFADISSGTVQSAEKENEEADKTTYTGAAGLKTDIQKLTSASLYEKVKDKDGRYQYDIDQLFAAAKDFVGNYNAMLDAAGSSVNSGVTSNLARVMERTAQNKSTLEKFGIHVDQKGRMKIDEDVFKNSDMSRVQDFFKEYGSAIEWNVSLVDYYMTTQADASNGYTSSGMYNAQGGLRYDGVI